MKIADIEWVMPEACEQAVIPVIAAGQCRTARMRVGIRSANKNIESKPSEKGPGGVAAILLYARVSPEVAARLDQMKTHPVKLAPQEWVSGDVVRTILVVGTKAAVEGLRK